MRSKLPPDTVLVDPDRRIVPPWLEVLRTIEPLLSVLTPENIATLKALISNGLPGEDTTDYSAFGRIDAYNETDLVEAGHIDAVATHDRLAINIDGSGNVMGDAALRALNIGIGGGYASIPETGVLINNMGVTGDAARNVAANRIYACPVMVPSRRSFTTIGWRAENDNAVNDGNWSASIYSNVNGRPAVKLATTDTQFRNATGGGGASYQSVTIPTIILPGGIYWVLWTSDTALGTRGAGTLAYPAMGITSTLALYHGWYRDATFDGTLPDESGSAWTATTDDRQPHIFIG